MITLSGNLAEFYVGYKVAVTLTQWQLTRGLDTLGSIRATGTGVVSLVDFLNIGCSITKAMFRLGNCWWVWRSAELTQSGLYVGGTANFQVFGDPEIREGLDAAKPLHHARNYPNTNLRR